MRMVRDIKCAMESERREGSWRKGDHDEGGRVEHAGNLAGGHQPIFDDFGVDE